MSEIDNIKELIESSWENIAKLSPENKDVIDAVNTAILKLDSGELRIAEKKGNNEWQVNQWLKKAVLISFRINENSNLFDAWEQIGSVECVLEEELRFKREISVCRENADKIRSRCTAYKRLRHCGTQHGCSKEEGIPRKN